MNVVHFCLVVESRNIARIRSSIRTRAIKNSDELETTFSIDPQELISEYQNAEQRNLQVVGIFHSHPSLPYPSLTDKEFMEINPVVWLIHSTITHQTRVTFMMIK